MLTCVLCHWAEVALDDAVVLVPRGRCICLRCFDRETASALAMPEWLRAGVVAAAGSE